MARRRHRQSASPTRPGAPAPALAGATPADRVRRRALRRRALQTTCFEHTPDPLAELRRARELVGAGGVLLVGVPNLAGLSLRLKSWQSRCRLKRQRWKHYGALHHLWFFTPATLARIVAAAGFDVARSETPVLERPGRPAWVGALLRRPLEAARAGGIVDLYARAP